MQEKFQLPESTAPSPLYEWGQAEAVFAGGKALVDKYLTVWQRQPDGGWKILRNLVIPKE